MPIIIFILLVILVVQIGFWDTLGAVFGAIGVMILFVVILAAILGLTGYLVYARMRR